MRSRKSRFASLLVVLMTSLSTLAFQVPTTSLPSSKSSQRSDPAPIGISSCQNIASPGNYVLLQDLTAPSPCIIIRNVANVNLDCSGHVIFSTGGAPTISVTNSTNVAISGCTAHRSAEDGYALEILTSSSVNVTNNDLEAVHVENDTNVQVLSNRVLGA